MHTTDSVAKDSISFSDLGLDEDILKAIEAKGFVAPTPIQVLAIPRLLTGDANVIARARTGTGKTAAFGLPLVQELRADKGCPRALVLVPTRELALQVTAELDSLRSGSLPRTVTVYGGASMYDQLRALKAGVEVVIGTPGRVKDHLERGSLNLSKIDYFILDEADEMLNMGFIEDIEAIFARANPDARVLLFSATMPPAILSIASSFMGEYEIVEEEAGPEEEILTEQFYWVVREDDKTEALVRLIDAAEDFYGLVFCQTKADADAVARELDERRYEAAALHGDIAQAQREKILARFRSRKTRVLVATDVAARGIDIEGLSHVVNYALPYDGPTYTHRVGRTGRAGARGIAVTFVRPEERRRLGYLRHHARGDLSEGKVPTVAEVLEARRARLARETGEAISRFFAASENDSVEESTVERTAAADEAAAGIAAARAPVAIPEEFRALARELAEGRDPIDLAAALLAVQHGETLSPERYGHIRAPRVPAEGTDRAHLRLFVGIGRRDGLTKRGIALFFRDLIGVPERLVDRIEVMDAFSLATLPREAALAALDLAKRKRNVPHIHVDAKEQGGFAPQGRPYGPRGQGGPQRPMGPGGPRAGRPQGASRGDAGGAPSRAASRAAAYKKKKD
ncbi:MAG TPA: DEAD/DEAH box helicase [Treponemataceae bacterium]|nr:DEAD/DEAH box helicase [Treponemataceae bacterium]